MFTPTYKTIKKFESEIFKLTIPGKPDVEEAPRIERCEKTKIQEKYNITPQNLPVHYADMLPHITKNVQGKK